MRQIIVIGGGPAGMMAAITAARSGAQTTLLEAGPKPGRKLLLTGNGRCNLTNLKADSRRVYVSADQTQGDELTRSVFGQFSVKDTIEFFAQEGLLCSVEHEDYVYPAAGQSESVLKILLRTLQRLNVRMKYSEEVIGIECEDDGSPNGIWNVKTATWTYRADRVIVCCGSRAYPSTGSNGTGYELCRMLGMDVTDILPGLTAVNCALPLGDTKSYVPGMKKGAEKTEEPEEREDPLADAAGTRIIADVKVLSDGEVIAQESGQVQFTRQDVSGVVVFNLSRFISRALHEGRDVTLSIDLLPDHPAEELEAMMENLRSQQHDLTDADLLAGLIPSRLIGAVLKQYDSSEDTLAEVLKAFSLRAKSLRGFDGCQVCVGGVSVGEICPETLECKGEDLMGLYLAGELIDIDGPCGGYNLQWAWSSGFTAGLHAATDPDKE